MRLKVVLVVAGAIACGRTASNAERGPSDRCAGCAGEASGGGEAPGGSESSAPGGNSSDAGGSAGTLPLGGAATSEGGAATGASGEAGASPGGAENACAVAAARFASVVIDHAFGGGQSFNQDAFPEPILGPPEANEPRSVLSLGNGGFVVLAFDGNAIVDGPGVDFTVFENPLPSFAELATVAVSVDGASWVEFPCTAAQDADDYGACAGVARVYAGTTNGVDPLDASSSGGDQYDLADVGLPRARFVRITDRADLDSGMASVFDLDAVAIINAECP